MTITAATGESAVRIGNKEVVTDDPWPLTVTEPATGEPMAQLIGGGAADGRYAVDAAAAAFEQWAGTQVATRATALRAIAADLRDPATTEELAVLTARETGKRLAEARAEVGLSAGFCEWFADAIGTRSGELWNVVPGIRHQVEHRPVGIVAVLTPWNFPLSIPARKIAPALAAGCPVVFKPSEVAPLSGLAFARIAEAHLPAGVLNTVVGDAPTLSSTWLSDRRVRSITFTGSTRVGKSIAAQAVPLLVRTLLELGGNAPFVVLDDADLGKAIELLMVAKYRNNGQSCIAANQVWVPRAVLDDFVTGFAEASEALVLGDPLDEATTLGPLALPDDPARIAALVQDAEDTGARVIRSRADVPTQGQFASPAICVDPHPDSAIHREETFGPAVSISGYDDLDAVLAASRQGAHGLAGYVVSSDTARAADIARRIDAGIIGVNNATPNTPHIPFAGLKDSGIGAEGGYAGLEEFLVPQSVAVAGPE